MKVLIVRPTAGSFNILEVEESEIVKGDQVIMEPVIKAAMDLLTKQIPSTDSNNIFERLENLLEHTESGLNDAAYNLDDSIKSLDKEISNINSDISSLMDTLDELEKLIDEAEKVDEKFRKLIVEVIGTIPLSKRIFKKKLVEEVKKVVEKP